MTARFGFDRLLVKNLTDLAAFIRVGHPIIGRGENEIHLAIRVENRIAAMFAGIGDDTESASQLGANETEIQGSSSNENPTGLAVGSAGNEVVGETRDEVVGETRDEEVVENENVQPVSAESFTVVFKSNSGVPTTFVASNKYVMFYDMLMEIGIPTDGIRLVYDEKTLDIFLNPFDYQMEDGDTVEMLVRFRWRWWCKSHT